jgi:hypothetical protein
MIDRFTPMRFCKETYSVNSLLQTSALSGGCALASAKRDLRDMAVMFWVTPRQNLDTPGARLLCARKLPL